MVASRGQLAGERRVDQHVRTGGWWRCTFSLVAFCALVSSGAALLPQATVWAGEGGESYTERLKRQLEEWEKQEQEEGSRRSLWQKRLAKRQYAVENALAAVSEAKTGRIRAHDGRYAGVSRSEWTRRWKEAQAELNAAEKALEALPEEARRAGAPPGWLR